VKIELLQNSTNFKLALHLEKLFVLTGNLKGYVDYQNFGKIYCLEKTIFLKKFIGS
jgi:hypothetical protein